MNPRVIGPDGFPLNPRKLRMVEELGIPYDDITEVQYQAFKRSEYIKAYSDPRKLGDLIPAPSKTA